METPRSSSDSDSAATPDSEASTPKRRTRLTRGKTAAAPRTRKKAAPTEESAEVPAAAASHEEAPVVTREAPRETLIETPHEEAPRAPREEPVQSARDEAPQAPRPVMRERRPGRVAAPVPQQEVLSFSPDDEAPPAVLRDFAPAEPPSAAQSDGGGEAAAASSGETPAEPGVGAAPAGEGDREAGQPGADQAPGQAGGPLQAGKRYGRDYWKQLKLEKKKSKMLRQHGHGGGQPGGGQPDRGGPGGPGGFVEPRGGGQFHRGGPGERPDRGDRGARPERAFRDRPERPPQQPPPPNFVQVTGDLPQTERFADLAALETLAVDIISGGGEPLAINELAQLSLADLATAARNQGVTFDGVPNRFQMLKGILQHAAEQKRPIVDRGWLDLTDRGYGFIVHAHDNYRLYPDDTFVPESLVKRYGLKRGVQLEVQVQAPQGNERCPASVKILSAMGRDPALLASVTPFEELEPYYPLKRILLEVPGAEAKDISMRLVDIVTPIGFGQRGLIVAPPRTGKTVLMQNIANAVSDNFPEVKLIILLVDERPEEVTDFKRHTRGEVVSSTFDETPESHVHCAEMVVERARRMIEHGEHVVILLDSITRLARAYNNLTGNSGKIGTGGLDTTALQKPKRFFGSARNIEGAGSLTIVGTALIDTGSKMDEVIFEEFKGTGNMELHLDRDLVNKRIFPAVNMDRSGTRKEELLYHPDELQRIFSMRRTMQGLPGTEAMEMLISRLKKTKTNVEFLMGLNR
ncbi:MAG: transcription termination factor Rho [Opitutaceae bacterium]|nr:transcription termination factor Rho [Opitutaceae bacterium]